MHDFHLTETVVAHFKHSQICKASQIQHSEGFVITTIVIHNNGFHTRIQCIQLIHRMYIGVGIGIESRMIG